MLASHATLQTFLFLRLALSMESCHETDNVDLCSSNIEEAKRF